MFRGLYAGMMQQFVRASGGLLRPLPLIVAVLLCSAGLSAQTVLVGNQTVEANLDSNATGLAEAFPATATTSGQVGSINFFLDESSASTKVYLGIYTDANGHPGSLLTQGNTTQLARGTWNSVIVNPVSISSGASYWIAILGTTGGKPYFRDRSTTSCHSQTSSQSNLTSLPSTWTTGQTWNTCYISAYAVSNTLPATALLGNQAIETYLDKNPAGRAEAFPATANSAGSVGVIALYLDPTSGSGPVNVGLYADNNGHPGTLLGQGSTSSAVAGSWNQISISASSITAGHPYWIAVLGTQATSPYFRDRQTTVCHSETTPQSNLTTLPATWSTGSTWNTCYISAYGLPAAGSPVLSLSTQSLSFSAIQGGANPSAQSVSVTNTGAGTLSFTAASDAGWLSVSPASGTAPQTLQVSASIGSLTAGTYTGHVTVTAAGAQGSPSVVTVTLTVAPAVPPAVLSLSTQSLSFSGTQGGTSPSPQSVSVTNTGGGTLSFTAASDSAWLSVSPASGTAPQTLQVSASVGSLAAGTYTGHVTVTAAGAQGSPSVVTVTLTVAPAVPPAVLSLSTQSLSFSGTQAGTNPSAQSVSVTNTGGGTLSFTAASDSAWLSVSPASGTAPQTLQVSASVGSLAAGTYTGHVTVTAAGAQGSPSVVTVTLTVAPAVPPAVLSVLPSGLSLSATQGGANPSAQSVSVTNTGGGTLSFTAASDSGWLSVSPAGGTAPQTLQVSASVGSLTAGTYTGHVTVTATGAQGSPSIVSVTLVVVLPGVVVGQVLSDVTGLPLKGATVQVEGGTNQNSTGDSGAYSIPVTNSHFFLSIGIAPSPDTGSPGTVTVEREIFVQSGVGTIPVDARLTAVAAPTSISTTGGSLTGGSVTIVVPPGAVATATNFYLTSLSQQGLPALLPLGWSPLLAFDLRSDAATGATFNANFTQLPNSLSVHLVEYSYSTHIWNMVAPNLSAANGALSIPIPSVGSYALVTADAGSASIAIPSAGNPLTGVAMVVLPTGVTASGTLNPPSVSPTGGTSMATLAIQSPVPLPSGTVIQANVLENYSLVSGKKLSDAARTEDLLVYQYSAPAGAAAVASFPVTPSQTFKLGQVSSGDVHLDILSGRESIRGQVAGTGGVTVTGGDATLSLAAGALTQTTAVAVTPESTDSVLPSTPQLIPLAEYNIDLSGLTLTVPAQLMVAAGTAKPGDNIFLVQIVRIQGAPYLVAVSGAQVTGSNLVTQAPAGLSGILQGGDYVFYKVTAATGWVAGTVSASSGPISALVQTDGLPFSTFTPASGSYVIPALAGQVNLTAAVLNTAVSGTTSIPLTAGQTATANITVVGQVESATVTPANGSVGISLTAEIDITAADAFSTANSAITASNFALNQIVQGTGTPVPIRFVISPENTRIAVFPQSALQPSTTYTFAATGLTNVLGGITSVPAVSFTTQANTPPNFNTNALVFAMPDQNGNTQISAPANSFPPGTTILIVDQTNGVVLSLTVANDGSVTGQMPATIDDVLAVTITAPDKTTATFTRSQFVAPDGTTAIGPGGGTVTGPGNTGIIIPAGGLTKGATFKLDLLDQSAFPQLPSWPGANFGSGIQITAPAMPSFNKEAKLAFPVPANAPPGAFYYVYRRLVDPNDSSKVLFETIDHAFVQGTGGNAQVVTASPPFCGYMNSFGNFLAAAAAGYQPLQTAITITFMMWDYDPNQAGVASQGLLAGKVFQNDANGDPGPLSNGAIATITLTNNPQYMTTTTPACGTYSLFDPQRGGGTRSLTATATLPTFDPSTGNTVTQKQTIVATSDEVNGIQPDDSIFSVTAGLEAQYRNIGRFNFTFAPPAPPPPPPQIIVGVYTLDANGNRLPVSGIVQAGTNLVITFASTLTVVGATINGTPFSSVIPDSPPANPAPNFNYTRLSDAYPTGPPGVYTITANALNALNPSSPMSVSRSLLVVAPGGGNTVATPSQPPQVVASIPSAGAQGVPTAIFPDVTFSEPVTGILGNVALAGNQGDSPSFLLVGIRSDGSLANPVTSSDAITSLTIQPLTGLEFNETYTLTLSNGIMGIGKDQNGNPIPLPTFTLQFTTYGPQQLGTTSSQYEVLTRPVVIGQRAYVGEYLGTVNSGLGIFDISDPSKPVDKGVGASVIGRVIDIAGTTQSATGGPLVALSAGSAQDLSIPGNVWLYDVSIPDQPSRVGAVSVSSSATQAGIAMRMAIKDKYLYASTLYQGLQVVDLSQALAEYQQVFSTNPTQFGQAVSTEGDGFAMDSIVNTIQLPTGSGGTYTMFGLAVDDFGTSGLNGTAATQTLMVATGQLPFVMADPSLSGTQGVLWPASSATGLSSAPLQMTSSDGSTMYQFVLGRAVALGTIPVTDTSGNTTNKHLAVVVGSGRLAPAASINSAPAVPVLAVVDLSQVYTPGQGFTPMLVGMLALVDQNGNPVTGTDVKLNGSVALVATGTNVMLVNLAQPSKPVSAGQISGSFSNWIAVTDTGFLVGTTANVASTGIQTASLGTIAIIHYVTPQIPVDANSRTTNSIEVDYEFQGNTQILSSGSLNVQQDGKVVGTIPLPDISPGIHKVTIPSGTLLLPAADSVQATVMRPDGTVTASITTSLGALPNDVALGGTSSSSASTSSSPSSTSTGTGAGGVGSFSAPIGGPLQATVTPDHVVAGQGDAKITLSGYGFEVLTSVFVRGLDGTWNQLTSYSQAPGQTTFTLPSLILTSPGFLEISATGDDRDATVPLPIADPSLPQLGTAPQLTPQSVSVGSSDAQGNPAISVSNALYASGMDIVLGQGQTPVLKLFSSASQGSLLATQPSRLGNFANSFTFIAVLSANGSGLSWSVPLPYATAQFPYEAAQPLDTGFISNAASSFSVGDVEVTGSSRNPDQTGLSSSRLGELELQGVGLSNGMTVQFAAFRGNQMISDSSQLTGVEDINPDQSPSTPPPSSDPVDQRPDLMSGLAKVPDSLQKIDIPYVSVIGYDSAGRLVSTSAPDPLNVGPLNVPFGGRVAVGAYRDPKNGAVYVLTADEAKALAPVGLQLVTNATLSVTSDPSDSNPVQLAQIEIEPADPAGFEHVRGLSLNRNSAPQVTLRPTGTIQANVQNAQPRTLFVYFTQLGTTDNWYDPLIAQYANMHNIPPQYLKGQAVRESDHFSKNFRYEPSTIDFNTLTGDNQTGGQLILTAPFCYYAETGTYLTPTPNSEQITNQFTMDDSIDSANTQFSLYDPSNASTSLTDVKRRNGIIDFHFPAQRWSQPSPQQPFLQLSVSQQIKYLLEAPQTAVSAVITSPNAVDLSLNLVRSGPLWRKLGTIPTGYPVGAWQDMPPDPLHFSAAQNGQPLIPDGFTVDYDKGIITLANPLAAGQTLTIQFWASDRTTDNISSSSTCKINGQSVSGYTGTWLPQAPDLNNAGSKFQGHPIHPDLHLVFPSPGQTESLYDFHAANIKKYSQGAHVSGTDSDRQLEFKTAGLGQPPSVLLDPKYKHATAQPYAASSYGILQLTLGAWTRPDVAGTLKNAFNVIDPNAQDFHSVFDLIDFFNGDKTNFDLAGKFHEAEVPVVRKMSPQKFCGAACNQVLWAKQWATVTTQYNKQEDFYFVSPSGQNALAYFGDACFQPGTDPGPLSNRTQSFSYLKSANAKLTVVPSICIPTQKSR